MFIYKPFLKKKNVLERVKDTKGVSPIHKRKAKGTNACPGAIMPKSRNFKYH